MARFLILSDLHTEFAGLQPAQVCRACHSRFGLDTKVESLHAGPCSVCHSDGETYIPGVHGKLSCAWIISRQLPPADSYDAVILAGDIGIHTHGLRFARTLFPGKRIIYVAGNHEFYQGAHIYGLVPELRKAAATLGIDFLERDSVSFDGFRILGATLWTDFQLYGATRAFACMSAAKMEMPDFNGQIRIAGSNNFSPIDSVQLNRESRAWLTDELRTPFDGKTIVVTHHLPLEACVAERFRFNPVSAAFASEMPELVEKATLWVAGHTHDALDFEHGNCRVVVNPRGYPSPHNDSVEGRGFRPDLIVELS